MGTVHTLKELLLQRKSWKSEGKTVVFTNGVFDILHRGHAEYLAAARRLGDVLVVGVNTDESVKRLKGPSRPIVRQEDRAFLLSQLISVDAVCLFDEDTPLELISHLVPDILVKGADYQLHEIVGRDIVERSGGKVITLDFIPDRSTSSIINTILSRSTP